MSKWYKSTLEKITDIRLSNVDKKIVADEISVRLCNYMDAYNNDYLDSNIKYSQGSVKLAEIDRFGLMYGDVIITKDSETPDDIAVPAVVVDELENVICGYHLAILRPQKAILDGVFLMNVLKEHSVKQWFIRKANGITRYGLSKTSIENAIINYPERPVQRKIARILTIIDKVIEQTENTIEKLKKIKQGMMHDLFTRSIDVKTGKLHPPYSESPELYKQSKFGRIPREWEIVISSNYCDSIADGTHDSPKPKERGVPLVTSKNLTEFNELNWKEIYYITPAEADEINKRSFVNEWDILFGMIGTIGNPVIIRNQPFFSCKNVGIFRFSGNSKKSEFFYHSLGSRFVKKQFATMLDGSTQGFLSLGNLRDLKLVKPKDSSEIEQINSKLNNLDSLLKKEYQVLYKYKQLKQGLMQDILTGKVEVMPDPQDKELQEVG